MLEKKMVDAINEQITKELYSAYLYLSMAAYAANSGLNGFANWFSVQVKEELTHAEKMYQYLIAQGVRVSLAAIDKPPQDFRSASGLFEKTLAHEQTVTRSINALIALARRVNDYATEAFLQWFVTEQVEEEANATENLNKCKLVGKDGQGLLMIDAQLAGRVFTPPVTGQNAPTAN